MKGLQGKITILCTKSLVTKEKSFASARQLAHPHGLHGKRGARAVSLVRRALASANGNVRLKTATRWTNAKGRKYKQKNAIQIYVWCGAIGDSQANVVLSVKKMDFNFPPGFASTRQISSVNKTNAIRVQLPAPAPVALVIGTSGLCGQNVTTLVDHHSGTGQGHVFSRARAPRMLRVATKTA